MLRLVLLCLALSLISPAPATEATGRLEALRAVMTDRLALMTDVAMFKWNAGAPVEDIGREAVVLEATVREAVARGLDPEFARRMVESQIAAAKTVQQALFDAWAAADIGAFAEAPSLTDTLRPEIGRLTADLIRVAKAAGDGLATCEAHRILAPPPKPLARFPDAWAIAVGGVVDSDACP